MKKVSYVLFLFLFIGVSIFAQQKRTVAISISTKSDNANILINSYLSAEVSKIPNVRLITSQKNADFLVRVIAIQNANQYYFSSAITENLVINGHKVEKYWTSSLHVSPSENIRSSCKLITAELKDSLETASILKRMTDITGQ